MLIAEGLSEMDSSEAQVALLMPLDATGSEQIELLAYATASVRSFGNKTRQIKSPRSCLWLNSLTNRIWPTQRLPCTGHSICRVEASCSS